MSEWRDICSRRAMATTTTSISLSLPDYLSKPLNPKPRSSLTLTLRPTKPSLSFVSATLSPFTNTTISIHKKATPIRRIHANATPAEPSAVETAQQIVSAGNDGASTIISGLLLVAFVALSLLTVGVIYIAVSDLLQKREKDKFEKEEEASGKKKKKKKKKNKSTARAGPRGFGQKRDDDDEIDDLD